MQAIINGALTSIMAKIRMLYRCQILTGIQSAPDGVYCIQVYTSQHKTNHYEVALN